jgi:hypothetical protein
MLAAFIIRAINETVSTSETAVNQTTQQGILDDSHLVYYPVLNTRPEPENLLCKRIPYKIPYARLVSLS